MVTMSKSPGKTGFLGAPFAPLRGAERADFAYLGIPLVVEYGDEPVASADAAAATAPAAADAVRIASACFVNTFDHHDFDLGGPLVPAGCTMRLVDCGDVEFGGDLPVDIAAATAAVRDIVAVGAVPLVVAGDHSVPPVVVRGLDDTRPLDILHVDAHLDFRDEVAGIRDGYSSPIRRLRELPWVRTVVQVGLRDVGSARDAEVAAARAAGNILVRAEEVHERGVDGLAELFPEGGRVYITIDVDGLDPSCAPGTLWPAPGGLWFWQVARLLRGVIARSALAGMDICEFVPRCDPQGHTALAAARLLMNAVGAELRRRR
jgi:agmatinase